jgi:N-acetylglucosaminyldiphosphoundecaprenol N-acetyl-beta-D-mannosaminyltransferase
MTLPARPSQNFLGVRVEAITFEQMFDSVDRWIADKEGRSHHIACINAYCVTSTLKDARLARIYNGSDIAGADGMPFVHWLRWVRRQPCDRLYAPDVVRQLASRAAVTGYTFYLYGGAPEVLAAMQSYLEREFPHISIVGSHSPPFRPLTPEELSEIREEINGLMPDIICVGLGTPKQDYWIDENLEAIRGAVLVACGATFDFFGGRVRMAPRFVQRAGFEWAYRLLGPDFRRLWRRYTIDHVTFLYNFALQLLGIRVRRPKSWTRDGRPGD